MSNLFKPYPQSLADWRNPELTLFRKFDFTSAADIEILIVLVKANVPDYGNHRRLRARLLTILHNRQGQLHSVHLLKLGYPRTWYVRHLCRDMKQWIHRVFNTAYFRNCVEVSRMIDEIIEERNARGS